jgi:hypothetical protein
VVEMIIVGAAVLAYVLWDLRGSEWYGVAKCCGVCLYVLACVVA